MKPAISTAGLRVKNPVGFLQAGGKFHGGGASSYGRALEDGAPPYLDQFGEWSTRPGRASVPARIGA